MFSLRLMLVLSRSMVTPFLSCTTLPKMSEDNHSNVSLERAEPLTTLPTVVIQGGLERTEQRCHLVVGFQYLENGLVTLIEE